MKKFLSSLMVVCLLFIGTISTVSAVGEITADEQKILDVLKAGVTVDGVKVELKAADINAATNYLRNNNVEASKVTVVLNNIEAAKSYVVSHNIKDLAAIKGTDASAILVFIQGAASELGLTVKVNSIDNTIAIYAGSEVVYSTTNVIKKTGYDFTQSALMVGGLVALLAATGYLAKRKQLLVK